MSERKRRYNIDYDEDEEVKVEEKLAKESSRDKMTNYPKSVQY